MRITAGRTSRSLPHTAVALALLGLALTACADPTSGTRLVAPSPLTDQVQGPATRISYDAKSLAEYGQMWANPYGRLQLDAGGTLTVNSSGDVRVRAVPYTVGADYSVYDHLKYIAISTQSFPVPQSGSVMFSVRITAQTPGTQAGRLIRGCAGAGFSFVDVNAPCIQSYAQPALEGQQAGVVLNMINFATGQLFDWFVSGTKVFALIERLPSNVTNPTLPTWDPNYVGLEKAYTQIIKEQDIVPGKKVDVAIRYTRGPGVSRVEYFLDGALFASVNDVGVPLDVQGVPFTGYAPSYGRGEVLSLDSFVIGHGLFSLLDAFPYQHPERPDLSISIPMSERLFGQGADGTWEKFTVTTQRQ